MRTPTILLGALWAAMSLVVLWYMPEHSRILAWLSLFYPAYYTVGSFVYHLRSS
jgi:hypothetical protein